MPIESFEKGEKQVCPICGAPYYAECEHMKHPDKFSETKGKPAKIQLDTKDTEALTVHKKLIEKIVPGGITSSDIESALEKLTEDEKESVSKIVDTVIEENKKNPFVQEFLDFERRQANLPKEVARARPVREFLVDTILTLLDQRKKMFTDRKKLDESLKKAVINKIRTWSEQNMFKLRHDQ